MSERYMARQSAEHRQVLTRRGAAELAGFFIPYLKPGTRLLDCGCGPGGTTLDLAALVAPGEAVGIDLGADEIADARALARKRGITSARFEVANVYELPFPDGSFDAVYAQMLFLHLREPLRALAEIRRVLRPGGFVGIVDSYWGALVIEPSTQALDRFRVLTARVLRHHGGAPYYGPRQKRLLLRAGFTRVEGSGGSWPNLPGSQEDMRATAEYLDIMVRDIVGKAALAEGWIDVATLEQMRRDVRAWGERPDAFILLPVCRAVGWVPASLAARSNSH